MTRQITLKNLEGVVGIINKLTDSPPTSYTRAETGFVANIGNYHLDGAYGGWKLRRMCNEKGGVSDVLGTGYCSKRELYDQLHAFLRGIEAKEEKTKS